MPVNPPFPAAPIDPGEDAIAAALREGMEETGLDPASVLPVALFPELYLPPSGFLVSPVLAYWRDPGRGPAGRPGRDRCGRQGSGRRAGRSGQPRAGPASQWLHRARRSRWPTCWSGGSPPGWSMSLLELGGWSRAVGPEPGVRAAGVAMTMPDAVGQVTSSTCVVVAAGDRRRRLRLPAGPDHRDLHPGHARSPGRSRRSSWRRC